MRKLLLLALLLLLSNFGQAQTTGPGFVIYVGSAPSGTCSAGAYQEDVIGLGTVYTCQSGTWTQVSGGGGSGVTSVATTTPITGGTITGTGTIACATCVKATSPGAGIAHFAGSTQEVTSSLIVAADIASGATAVVQPGVRYCANVNSSTTATNTCSSTNNVATNDVIILFCSYFLSDAGASTASATDTLSNTYTLAKKYYSSTATETMAVFWTKSGSAGADTFSCTSTSSSASFWGTVAVQAVGASGTSPIDVAGTGNQGTSITADTGILTTLTANDLIFTIVNGGNNSFRGAGSIFAPSTQGTWVGARNAGAAGTYSSSVEINASNVWAALAVAIH